MGQRRPVVGWVDVETNGFRLNGAMLIRAARGPLLLNCPEGLRHGAAGRIVEIVDRDLAAEMAETAYDAFEAMGGCE